jgi:hypothetical protein
VKRKLKKALSIASVILVVALSMLFILALALSEVPVTEWEKTYGGANYDIAFSIAQTIDNGYVLAGATESYGAGGYDVWLVKTDSEGNLQWSKTYGGPYHDGADCVLQTDDGGYALVGQFSVSFEHEIFWFIKTDSEGNMEWNKTYGGANRAHAFSIVQTIDEGYALAGAIMDADTGNVDVWLVKTDSVGNMEWNKTYGGAAKDSANSILQTIDGGYTIAGYTYSFGAGNGDFWLVKTDSEGNIEWSKTYGGSNHDSASSIIQTDDGGYLLAGTTNSFGAGSYDLWLVKTDQHGNREWSQTYGGPNDEGATYITQTRDDGYIITGRILPLDGLPWYERNSDGWLIKTDSIGNVQWNQTYGGAEFDEMWSVVQTSDGGYAVAGYTKSFGSGMGDFWLVKIAPEKLSAIIDIVPDTLNLWSNGKWITCYIELPGGYDVSEVNATTILLNNTIQVEPCPIAIGDYDEDGIPDLMVKFDRAEVVSYILANVDLTKLFEERFMAITLTVTGKLNDDTPFQGNDAIRIIYPNIGGPRLIPR